MKISGILLNIDGEPYIRQYTRDGEFRDIKIVHDDLGVQVNDETAQIRQYPDGEYYIDYNNQVLGRSVK